MFSAYKVKTLNFRRSHLGGLPIFEHSFFVRFDLFLISTHSENVVHLPLKVQNFGGPVSGDPHFGNLKFCQVLSFHHIYQH